MITTPHPRLSNDELAKELERLTTGGPLGVSHQHIGICVRKNIDTIITALTLELREAREGARRARSEALEEAAKLADAAGRAMEKIGREHDEDSPSRDRCFARSREATQIAQDILLRAKDLPPGRVGCGFILRRNNKGLQSEPLPRAIATLLAPANDQKGDDVWDVGGATPALALCAAILRAAAIKGKI